MSIFVCDECGVRENTATSYYWNRLGHGLPALCSQCDPDIGRWHGLFDRVKWEGEPGVVNRPAADRKENK